MCLEDERSSTDSAYRVSKPRNQVCLNYCRFGDGCLTCKARARQGAMKNDTGMMHRKDLMTA